MPKLKSASTKKLRIAARDVMLSEFQKIIDQTVLPALTQKLNAHHKVLYGNGKPGLITELAVFRQSMDDKIKALTESISGKEGVTDRLTKMETWQVGMTKWKDSIIVKVAAICGFCSGLGTLLGLFLSHLTIVKKFLEAMP